MLRAKLFMEDETLQDRLLNSVKNNLLVSILGFSGLICLGAGLIYYLNKPEPQIEFTSEPKTEAEEKSVKTIFVDVGGSVKNPGLYELEGNARIHDALKEAGGLTEEADTTAISKTINLAQPLEDGTKLYFPKSGDPSNAGVAGLSTNQQSNGGTVNINSANLGELDKLPGIGQVRAQKIIDNRPYSDKKELVNKKVVTQKIYSEIEALISTY